jgi:hypothetical protein
MANKILIRRGLKSGLTTIQGAGQLTQGEPYLITGDTVVTNDQARLAIGLDTTNYIIVAREDKTQPLDADLTAIAALSGTSGFLKKTAANTWTLDVATYLTAETDTLGTVTGRGASTTTAVTFSGGVTVNDTGSNNGVLFRGSGSGTTTVVAAAAAGGTLTLPATTGTLARTADIGAATLNLTVSGAAASGSAIGTGTNNTFNANSSGTAIDYTITVGPAISALATLMATGGAGFIKRTGTANTYEIDTATYTTTSTSLSSFAAPAGDLDLNSKKITNLADPASAQDAATKAYVDGVAQGLDIKASVRLATASSISSLSGAQTIDGTAVATNDRILVKNHTTASQNGIWIANTGGAWTRAPDANVWTELISAFTFVEEGTANADTSWVSTVNAGGALDTTAVTFVQFGAAGAYSAGNGLTLTGSVFDVVGTTDRITVATDSIDIASTYVGQTSITTLGTIATGTWNATAIGATKGGTGQTTFATGDILYASGTNTLTKLTKPASLDSLLQMTSAGVPSWISTIDGGTF